MERKECHKTSLFLLKFHALFNGSLDSFSTSGRTGGAQGNAKVMQRWCKGNARRITEAFRFNKNVHFRVYPGIGYTCRGFEHWSQRSQPCNVTIRPRRRLKVIARRIYLSRPYKYNETDINGDKWRINGDKWRINGGIQNTRKQHFSSLAFCKG